MELSINNNVLEPNFRFEHTKHKLGVRIWGNRRSFHELHELLGECWDCENVDMSHADWKVYDDTEVELHYRPSTLRNLLKNRFLQKWANTFGSETYETRGGIVIPSTEFNRVYLLLHCYRHIIGAGIGLRQLMDYYFCLNGYVATADEQKKTNEILNKLGLKRFAGAVMYVLEVVFGLDKDSMICAPNTVEGEYLLKQIVIGGNFGRYDGRAKRERKQVVRKVLMNLRYIFHYPNELIWALPFRIFVNLWEIRHTPKHTSN